jgi:hypothetical protein
MNFVFEKIVDELPLNFTDCTDTNKSGIGRITVSPVISTFLRTLRTEAHLYRDIVTKVKVLLQPPENERYIIPVGVAHSPHDWCGADKYKNGYNESYPDRKPLLAHLSEVYLKDMQDGKAFLLIDQTHEGYQTDWLWEWFHNVCNEYNIPVQQIIYVTGNMDCEKQYSAWADGHNLIPRMLVIPLPHFEHVVNEIAKSYDTGHLPPGVSEKRKLPNFEDHVQHKTQDSSKISMFNVLQKRPRAYRLWLFKYLVDAALLEGNIVTMNKFEADQTYFEGKKMSKEEVDELNKLLPLLPRENPPNYTSDNFEGSDGANYVLSLNDLTILDSWCTVISEASYGDQEGACFLSEKTFKPISCQQPFIIFGSKGSLEHLHNLGYKTFHPYIDESYDSLPTWQRLEAITKEMKKLNAMSDQERLDWFKMLEPIVKHNFENLQKRSVDYSTILFGRLKDYIGEQNVQ